MPEIDEIRATVPRGWAPRAYQIPLWEYLQKGGLRADVAAHRRWGKDEVAMHWAAQKMATEPGVYWHLLPEASQGRRAVWEAVNPHTGLKRIDEAFRRSLRDSTRNDEMAIEYKNGSLWRVLGSDNYDSLVGAPPRGVVFSEWALAKPEAWAYIRPILAENGGWAIFLSADDANRRQSGSFNNAQLRAENDDRRMRAAQGLADLSSSMDANTRANAASQAAIGGTLRGIDDARAKAPIDLRTAQLGLFSNLPVELFKGETSTSSSQSTGTSKTSGFHWDFDNMGKDFGKVLGMFKPV
jgi:hypothetical protein